MGIAGETKLKANALSIGQIGERQVHSPVEKRGTPGSLPVQYLSGVMIVDIPSFQNQLLIPLRHPGQ